MITGSRRAERRTERVEKRNEGGLRHTMKPETSRLRRIKATGADPIGAGSGVEVGPQLWWR